MMYIAHIDVIDLLVLMMILVNIMNLLNVCSVIVDGTMIMLIGKSRDTAKHGNMKWLFKKNVYLKEILSENIN